MTPER